MDRLANALLAMAFAELAFERDVDDFIRRYDAGEVPPLSAEDEAAMERGKARLMANLRYYDAEGVFPERVKG